MALLLHLLYLTRENSIPAKLNIQFIHWYLFHFFTFKIFKHVKIFGVLTSISVDAKDTNHKHLVSSNVDGYAQSQKLYLGVYVRANAKIVLESVYIYQQVLRAREYRENSSTELNNLKREFITSMYMTHRGTCQFGLCRRRHREFIGLIYHMP